MNNFIKISSKYSLPSLLLESFDKNAVKISFLASSSAEAFLSRTSIKFVSMLLNGDLTYLTFNNFTFLNNRGFGFEKTVCCVGGKVKH